MDNVAKAKTVHIQCWVDPIQLADIARFMESATIPSNRISDIVRFAFHVAHERISLPPKVYCKSVPEAINYLRSRGLLREKSARSVKAVIRTLTDEDRRLEQLQGLIDSFSGLVPGTADDIHFMADNPPKPVEEEKG